MHPITNTTTQLIITCYYFFLNVETESCVQPIKKLFCGPHILPDVRKNPYTVYVCVRLVRSNVLLSCYFAWCDVENVTNFARIII